MYGEGIMDGGRANGMRKQREMRSSNAFFSRRLKFGGE
jgi:hypothetical protein